MRDLGWYLLGALLGASSMLMLASLLARPIAARMRRRAKDAEARESMLRSELTRRATQLIEQREAWRAEGLAVPSQITQDLFRVQAALKFGLPRREG